MIDFQKRQEERERLTDQLLANIKDRLPELEETLQKTENLWRYEDRIYRFYHQSFKVYDLQDTTVDIVDILRSLLPDRQLNAKFLTILKDGTGKDFSLDDNARWLEVTRPILEAFFHAHFFLQMAVKFGRELEAPPVGLPSGWVALLYLYNLR